MIDPHDCWGCCNLLYTALGFTCNRKPRTCVKDKSVTITWDSQVKTVPSRNTVSKHDNF